MTDHPHTAETGTPVESESGVVMCPVRMGDARSPDVAPSTVDLVVTSPPYWRKRDYGVAGQIGQEPTSAEYVAAISKCLAAWRPLLRPHGSVFLNVGDTYHRKSLAGIPARIERAAADSGWMVRNRIVWAKDGGMPEAVRDRLTCRHEFILHLALDDRYYYDLFGYSAEFGNGTNPGDVWRIDHTPRGGHLAPFPEELVRRCITLACPETVCTACGTPRRRIVERTTELDMTRPQARRAAALAEEKRLTEAHIAAIQATGISDAGKATLTQTGTGRNSAEVRRLAAEAKAALGGYFREFTFARRRTIGWSDCGCGASFAPGVVLDPFAGSGTTVRVAAEMGREGIGIDIDGRWAA